MKRAWLVGTVRLVAAAVCVVALAGCGDGSSSRTGTWYVASGADPSSHVLPIVVEYGPSCEEYAGVDVTESDESVEITVRLVVHEIDDGSACPESRVMRTIDVRLDDPLGGRAVGGPGHAGTPAQG